MAAYCFDGSFLVLDGLGDGGDSRGGLLLRARATRAQQRRQGGDGVQLDHLQLRLVVLTRDMCERCRRVRLRL